MGRNDAAFEVLAVLYSDANGIETWKEGLESLQGYVVSIINDLPATFANCLITKLGPLKNQPALADGGITRAEK